MSSDLLQQLQSSLGSEYLLERELGGGGTSRVFVVEERRFGRRVVVKVLNPTLSLGISAERFEREIRLAGRLQNPRIVPLLRAGRVGELPYYIMPYVEGESLRRRMAAAPLARDEAVQILRDVALALEYAHAQRIVHRDIKPENVLLADRTAVVTDFGIAKAINAATTSTGGGITSIGTVVGTPAYMSPEQAAGGAVDPRTDLYAWGVMAYELLAGVHPFAGCSTAQAVLAAQISDVPRPLGAVRPELPAALAALVDRCLAKDPDARPATASELLEHLNRAVDPPAAPRAWLPLRIMLPIAAVAVAAAAILGWLYVRSEHRHWALDVALPRAEQLRGADQSLAAYLLAKRAQAYLPTDTQVARVVAENTMEVSVTSTPPGAEVSIQDYTTPDSAWYSLGRTPIDTVRIPKGYFRWKVAKAGVGEYVTAPYTAQVMKFPIDSALAAPPGMVRVPEQKKWEDYIDFVGWVGPFTLPTFDIDRFEVTNRQYQAFIDSGGYRTPKYWTVPFVRDGHAIPRAQAMALFRDRTGRPGPSTWEGGHYPDGQADYPVSGVSWYEAAAYAAYTGKSLPTFAQWYQAAPPWAGRYVVAMSNISRSALAAVGTFKGVGPYGTYDMAGNVQEWSVNADNAGNRFILGGDWASQSYVYSDPASLSPFDRSPGNGIRCVRNLQPLPAAAVRPVTPLKRDFSKYHPAGDAVFDAYLMMYRYDRTPLNAKDEGVVAETPDWREEKVSFDAAYDNERITGYLFLPRRVHPPYQTVLFFPSARVYDLTDSRDLGDVSFFDYVVQSGRAVFYPVYQDTYERRRPSVRPGSAAAATVLIQRAKDVGRALDYLATRPDVATDKLAYMGVSMGAAEGVIYATLYQDRFKAVVLLDGGYFLEKPAPGTDQADFAPRLKKPVLMINGRYDFSFSPLTTQAPLFRMLGSPAWDKRHILLDTPHDVRADRPVLVKSVLDWLDRYLGPVQ